MRLGMILGKKHLLWKKNWWCQNILITYQTIPNLTKQKQSLQIKNLEKYGNSLDISKF